MTLHKAIFIFFAGLIGAVMNSMAGGGTFIGFPTLLFTGVPPIAANVTNNIAMLAGMMASGSAYREHLNVSKRILIPLVAASAVGGLTGALLLLKTSSHAFMHVIPWFMLGATLLFIFGKKLVGIRHLNVHHEATTLAILVTAFVQLMISVYGGYFGAGGSIAMLALFSAAGMVDIHAMNALRTILGVATFGIAGLYFIVLRAVSWPQAAVMIAGTILGGYYGAQLAKRLPQSWVRGFVMLVGAGMTVYFFVKTY